MYINSSVKKVLGIVVILAALGAGAGAWNGSEASHAAAASSQPREPAATATYFPAQFETGDVQGGIEVPIPTF